MHIRTNFNRVLVCTLTFALAESALIHKTDKREYKYNKKDDGKDHTKHQFHSQQQPVRCLSKYFTSLAEKTFAKAPDAGNQAIQYLKKDQPSHYQHQVAKLNSNDIFINIRRINTRYSQYFFFNPAEGLPSFLQFRQTLGAKTEIIFDDGGNYIGIKPHEEDKDRPDIDLTLTSLPFPIDALLSNENQEQCCTTVEVFFINSTLTDVLGDVYDIMQFTHTGSHQFIRHGICGDSGMCTGHCVQTNVNMALSVYPPEAGSRATHKFFSIPGYCSCKTFG